MRLEHALKTLEKELELLNTPLKEDEEEDDYIGAVLNSRKVNDIKLALKILNEFIINAKALSV
jgi:hypothetical protein